MMNTDPPELEVVLLADGSLEASFRIPCNREHLADREQLLTEIARITGRHQLALVSESSSRRNGEIVGSMKLIDLGFKSPKPTTGTWLTREEMQTIWVDPIEEIRFDFADAAPRADGSFEGFCDPCGGFRRHRLGCPLTRRSP